MIKLMISLTCLIFHYDSRFFYRALKDAISIFPGSVNTDVIFGRPGQSLQKWKEELSDVSTYPASSCLHTAMQSLCKWPSIFHPLPSLSTCYQELIIINMLYILKE